jgi:hypothetical protein
MTRVARSWYPAWDTGRDGDTTVDHAHAPDGDHVRAADLVWRGELGQWSRHRLPEAAALPCCDYFTARATRRRRVTLKSFIGSAVRFVAGGRRTSEE